MYGITEKQAGVLYGAIKRGQLQMPTTSENPRVIYDCTGWIVPTVSEWKASHTIDFLKTAINDYFNGDLEAAQNDLDIAFYYFPNFKPRGKRFGHLKNQYKSAIYHAVYGPHHTDDEEE